MRNVIDGTNCYVTRNHQRGAYMTRLKGMTEDETVFTVCVNEGQLTFSIPVEALDKHDDFSMWVTDNANEVNNVVLVAMEHERIVADETAAAIKSVQN